ncbi:MAG: hypothetical protein ACRDSH_24000 [Pseudonocardiaceae bacterium]
MSYAKAIVAVAAAAAVALQAALTDGSITPQEWVTIATAVLSALGVYLVPNSNPAKPEGSPLVTPSNSQTVPPDTPVTTLETPAP